MAYIDGEVRATCAARGWRDQVRRKDSARMRWLLSSPIGDYEWKLIPGELPSDIEGVYYVLSFDNGTLRLLHDTARCSFIVGNPNWETETYTEIRPGYLVQRSANGIPPAGWLRGHLLHLTTEFRPNEFSVT